MKKSLNQLVIHYKVFKLFNNSLSTTKLIYRKITMFFNTINDIIKLTVCALSLFVFLQFFIKYNQKKTLFFPFSLKKKLHLCFTGFLANIADTIGIGSFVVIVALNRFWSMIPTKNLPGTLNTHSLLPALIQCLAFLTLVKTDIITLITLLSAAILGSFIGASIISKFNKRKIKISMVFAYCIIAILVFLNQIKLLPIGGNDFSLEGFKLVLGFFLMLIVGIFPAVGVGGYTPIQIILFLLGLNPLVAWPVMTTAGSIQQSMAASKFLSCNKVSLKESMILAFAGIIGTIVTIPFVRIFDPNILRWLMFVIVVYNIITLTNDLKNNNSKQ